MRVGTQAFSSAFSCETLLLSIFGREHGLKLPLCLFSPSPLPSTAPSAALPYADGYFDVIIMHTLLSHVPEIHAILCEAHRVLSVAGRLIIFDADHASTTYSLPDFATTRETDLKLVSAISTHPAICRQLPVSKSFFITCFISLPNVPNTRQLSGTPQTRWLHTSVS